MIPTLYTPRLILRPFTLADAARVQELAGDPRIAATTLLIPHPYPNGAAESWINTHASAAAQGKNFTFAITLAGTRTPNRELDPTDTGHLIGAIDIGPKDEDPVIAAIGYWLGVPYWNKGFTTEAGSAILNFGFTRERYERIISCHFIGNPASGQVMKKIGMTEQPGIRTIQKNGQPIEVVDYALTREAWSRRRIIHRWKPAPHRALITT